MSTVEDQTLPEPQEPQVSPVSGETFQIEEPIAVEPTPSTPQESVEETMTPTEEFVQNVVTALLQFAVTSSREGGSPDEVQIPAGFAKKINKTLQDLPQLNVTQTPDQVKWASVLRASVAQGKMDDFLSERLAEEGSDFRQLMETGAGELRARMSTYGSKPGTEVREGEAAILRLLSHLGLGGLMRAPMWNSGFWVTFKPATETELLELNRIIVSDKILAGRWSYGLSLTNNVVYTLDRILEFVLDHVYTTSISQEDMVGKKLLQFLAPQDIESFIWGFLCSNYPSGFHYQTPCVKNPETCTHVIEETLNVTKLQWVDNSVFSDWQKQHMATAFTPNSKKLETIKRYQEESNRSQRKRVIVSSTKGHEVAITLKTPSTAEYLEQGHMWIGGLVDSVNRTMGEADDIDERNTMINKLNKATTLCQYVHWVESIEFGELSPTPGSTEEPRVSKIVDLTSVMNTLKELSAVDSLRETIVEEVLSYISHSTSSVIGVPEFDCPICGQDQAENAKKFPRHVSVIPLDVIQVFFELLDRRVSRIVSRQDR